MEKVTENNVVQIFDTTLRDGEQSPGASMTAEQKVVIARQLEKLGIERHRGRICGVVGGRF